MCGIAGRILTGIGPVGNDLVELMDAQEHRGADSTGFAIYGPVRDTGYVLRGMGFDKDRLNADLDDFNNLLQVVIGNLQMIEELDHWKKKDKTYNENLKLMSVVVGL